MPHLKRTHPKLPKMAIDRQEHHSNSTPRVLGVLHNTTPSPTYLGVSPQPEPTTALFIFTTTTVMSSTTNRAIFYSTAYLPLHRRPIGRPLAQRLSSSASSTCTSMASPPVIATSNNGIWSIGDPGICRAAHLEV